MNKIKELWQYARISVLVLEGHYKVKQGSCGTHIATEGLIITYCVTTGQIAYIVQINGTKRWHQHGTRLCHTTQYSMQLKADKLFVPRGFHLIYPDCSNWNHEKWNCWKGVVGRVAKINKNQMGFLELKNTMTDIKDSMDWHQSW